MVAQQSQSWRMGKPLFIKRRQISLKYHRNAWHIEAIDGTSFYGLLADKPSGLLIEHEKNFDLTEIIFFASSFYLKMRFEETTY